MSTLKPKSLSFTKNIFLTIAIFLVWSFTLKTCHARQGKQYWMPSKYVQKWISGDNSYNIAQEQKISSDNSAIFSVLDYGAKGDGKSDDTKVRNSLGNLVSIDIVIFKYLMFCYRMEV